MSICQISAFMENRAGQLSEITALLSENGIDLRAIHIAETQDYGVLRMIADRPRKAAAVLSERGYIVHPTPVTAAAVPDCPGGLHKVLQILAEAGVDIEYMYSVFGSADGLAYMIFRVEDPESVTELLRSHGITVPTGEDLGMKE